MLIESPTRREFIQTAAAAIGSLILPPDLRAIEDQRFWFLQTETGESWDVADPVSWCNSTKPILERAQEGLLKVTAADKDRVIRLVTRRCHLNLIEILPGRAVVHHWGQQGQGDLHPFFKTHGLAHKHVEVVVIDRKRETIVVQSGDNVLFGERLPQDWPTAIYLSKWERRNEVEPDDYEGSPRSRSGFAWDGIESGRIPWARPRPMWMIRPAKKKTSVTDSIKAELETKATDLIENVLKPKHVLPPTNDERFNYITDIWAKWNRNYFYFISTYACPGPNALSPTFESKFARLEYLGFGKFALYFMRHNEQWVGLHDGLTVDECLKAIQDDAWFVPRASDRTVTNNHLTMEFSDECLRRRTTGC